MFDPKLFNLLPVLIHGVQTAEMLKGASGAQKKQHVLSLLGDSLTTVQTLSGKKVLDVPEAQRAVSHSIDAVVAALNAVKKAKEQ